MDQFWRDQLIALVNREGGFDSFTNAANDRGGLTRAGLTQRFLVGYFGRNIDKDFMKSLTSEQILVIYYDAFVVKTGYINLPPSIAPAVVDFAVMAWHDADECLQKAINNCIGKLKNGPQINRITVDGKLGKMSFIALEQVKASTPSDMLLREFYIERMRHHINDCQRNPAQIKWLEGWFNRANKFMTVEIKDQVQYAVTG